MSRLLETTDGQHELDILSLIQVNLSLLNLLPDLLIRCKWLVNRETIKCFICIDLSFNTVLLVLQIV